MARHCQFCLSGEMDLRAWGGVALFERDGDVVTLPTASSAANGLVWQDAHQCLHGFGSQAGRDLSADGSALWTSNSGSGTLTVGIDPTTGHIFIEASAEDFTIDPSSNCEIWGFLAAGHGLVGGSAPFRRVAPNPWTRGPVEFTNTAGFITITPAVGTPFALPGTVRVPASFPTAIRTSAMGDADDHVANSLETLDNDACDPASRRIVWGIDRAGHVYYSRRSNSGDVITWLSVSFRNRLGFTGQEVEESSGTFRRLTAANPLCGYHVPFRPLDRFDLYDVETSSTAVLTSGSIASNHVATHSGVRISYSVDGPSDYRDRSRHILACYRDVWRRGAGLRLYLENGDLRRAITFTQVNNEQVAYSALVTSEYDGTRGSYICARSPDDGDPSLAWASYLRGSLPITIDLRFVPED